MNAKGTVKTLVSVSPEGQPHAIVCGTIASPQPDKMVVGEVLMKRSSEYLKANGKAGFSVTAGPKSYEIVVANPVRIESGAPLDGMNEMLKAVNLHAHAMWIFDVAAVYDESAGPTAGTKIA